MRRAALLVAVSSALAATAWADVPPRFTKDGTIVAAEQCPASQRAGLDCLLATRDASQLDAGTASQLASLGFRKVCEESHNDRYMAHLCRRPDPARPVPEELERALRGGALDQHGARMQAMLHESRCLAWLRAHPGVDPAVSPDCERVTVRGVREVDGGPCTGFVPCTASVAPPEAYLAARDAGGDSGMVVGDGGADDGGATSASASRDRGCGRCSAAPSSVADAGGFTAAGVVVALLAIASRSCRRGGRAGLSAGWRRRR